MWKYGKPRRLFYVFIFALLFLVYLCGYLVFGVFSGTLTGDSHVSQELLITINHDTGRLGNKLFKYAALLGIARAAGRRPFVNPYTADLDMTKVFNLTHVELHSDVDSLFYFFRWSVVTETMYAYFDPIFRALPNRDVFISGWVQSWKYFSEIRDEIRSEFSLLPTYRIKAQKVLSKIRMQNQNKSSLVFVGVHVRRKEKERTTRRPICEAPKSFFEKAFSQMKVLIPNKNLVFVVAGNDLDWCRRHLNGSDVVILEEDSAEVHFSVLASCQHGVVSVGSYGWWAAWLTGGHVVYYNKFPIPGSGEAEGFVHGDYYPPDWVGVDD